MIGVTYDVMQDSRAGGKLNPITFSTPYHGLDILEVRWSRSTVCIKLSLKDERKGRTICQPYLSKI